ncbi:MAG: 2-amino-4-hydroxy-6-hydroxymethyldihydropteridine diphosphokinase [Paracoccaceae bacterium]|nr:2-amino-4-hydroxy-6-hydroxymethyldihydropteridine diphosphokinase [Paracoccaceae bacterium]
MLSVNETTYSTAQTAYVALGGNVTTSEGTPEILVKKAISRLSGVGLRVVAQSRLYRTPSYPDPSEPEFVNACVAVVTTLTPEGVLERLHGIEAEFGRERLVRWGRRSLDLDLLAMDRLVLPDRAGFLRWRDLPPADQTRLAPDRLILPHPRLQDRAFVLVPLADIAADWVHPVLGQSVAALLANLPAADRASVRPIPGT